MSAIAPASPHFIVTSSPPNAEHASTTQHRPTLTSSTTERTETLKILTTSRRQILEFLLTEWRYNLADSIEQLPTELMHFDRCAETNLSDSAGRIQNNSDDFGRRMRAHWDVAGRTQDDPDVPPTIADNSYKFRPTRKVSLLWQIRLSNYR
jgi:hypothetical protein